MRAVMGGNSVAGDDVEKTRSFSTYVCMHAFSCVRIIYILRIVFILSSLPVHIIYVIPCVVLL